MVNVYREWANGDRAWRAAQNELRFTIETANRTAGAMHNLAQQLERFGVNVQRTR